MAARRTLAMVGRASTEQKPGTQRRDADVRGVFYDCALSRFVRPGET